MPAFSLNLIVRDSADSLPAALESLSGLSDDLVIIIDSLSQDASETIAGKYTSHTYVHDFSDFSSQRNFAVSRSRYDWIFSLDADEEVSKKLYRFLKEFSSRPDSRYSAYAVSRLNIIFSRPIRHTNWDPNGIVRLFNKKSGRWTGTVHEQWTTSGQIGRVVAPLIHHHYNSVEEFLVRLNAYTSQEASQIPRFSLFQFFWAPIWEFFRRFIIHAGFLDGFHGLFLSFLMCFYRLSVWIKVWQKQYVTT